MRACDLDASSAAARRTLPSPPVSLSLRLCPAEDGRATLEVHHWTGERAGHAVHCLHTCDHQLAELVDVAGLGPDDHVIGPVTAWAC